MYTRKLRKYDLFLDCLEYSKAKLNKIRIKITKSIVRNLSNYFVILSCFEIHVSENKKSPFLPVKSIDASHHGRM